MQKWIDFAPIAKGKSVKPVKSSQATKIVVEQIPSGGYNRFSLKRHLHPLYQLGKGLAKPIVFATIEVVRNGYDPLLSPNGKEFFSL